MTINAAPKAVTLIPTDSGTLESAHPSGVINYIFTDGFESGDISHEQPPARWTGWNGGGDAPGSVGSVQAGRGIDASFAANFQFGGGPAGTDASVELRFDLGILYKLLILEYSLYVPDGLEAWGGAAYSHSAENPSNNKFFRLWGTTYDDVEKVGASLFWALGDMSNLRAEWRVGGGGMGGQGAPAAPLIQAADLGKWMRIRISVKAATATEFGTVSIDKNGVGVVVNSNIVDNYTDGEAHGYRYGYLLGWANSGFNNTTTLLIDDVRISGELL